MTHVTGHARPVRPLCARGDRHTDHLAELLARGAVTPATTVIDFEEIPEYLDKLRRHEVTGRVVARIAE